MFSKIFASLCFDMKVASALDGLIFHNSMLFLAIFRIILKIMILSLSNWVTSHWTEWVWLSIFLRFSAEKIVVMWNACPENLLPAPGRRAGLNVEPCSILPKPSTKVSLKWSLNGWWWYMEEDLGWTIRHWTKKVPNTYQGFTLRPAR